MKQLFTSIFLGFTGLAFGQIDTVPPTVECLNGISVNIMPTGMIDIWESELQTHPIDDQTPAWLIETGICDTCTSFPAGQSSIRFGCLNLGTHEVKLWARDLAGNTSFCTSYVFIQDNNGNCPIDNKAASIDVKGPSGQFIQDVMLCINYRRPMLWADCDASVIPPFPISNNYQVSFDTTKAAFLSITKDGDIPNSANMLDVLKLQRHLTGKERLSSITKYLAADVNQDGIVNLSDYKEMRDVANGIKSSYSSNRSYIFYALDSAFTNLANAYTNKWQVKISDYPMKEYHQLRPGKQLGYIGILLGDVTGNGWSNLTSGSTDERNVDHLDTFLSIAPNPFSQTAEVQFYLPEAQKVTICIFNTAGRVVNESNGWYTEGFQNWTLDGNELGNQGYYFVRITTETDVFQEKVLFLK